MKVGRRFLFGAVVVGLLVALLALLQAWANRRLQAELPGWIARSGLPLAVSGVEVTVWNGNVRAWGVTLGHPPGFTNDVPLLRVEEVRGSIRFLPLLVGRLRFASVTARDVRLNLIRNGDGRLNLSFRKEKEAGAAPAGRPAPEPAESTESKVSRALPECVIDRLGADVRVTYADFKRTDNGKPYEATLELAVEGSGLHISDAAGDPARWGGVRMTGRMESGGRRSPVLLEGRMGPLSGWTAQGFRLTGSVEAVDSEMVRPLLGRHQAIKGRAERLDLDLKAEGGRYDERESRLVLKMEELTVAGRSLGSGEIRFPVHGKIGRPRVRSERALAEFLARTLLESGPEKEDDRTDGVGRDLEHAIRVLESLIK